MTELVGDEFLRAWWATVGCHLVLWRNGVYHRDINPSNLLYYRDEKGNVVGILIDFDLASTGRAQRITGAAPFMALDLLTDKALRGANVQHLYEHDAESFVWVLTWICLRYSDGKHLKNESLDKWLKGDAKTCRKEKGYLFFCSPSLLKDENYPPGKGHEFHLKIAQTYLVSIYAAWAMRDFERSSQWGLGPGKPMGLGEPMGPGAVFKKLFIDPIREEYRESVFAGQDLVALTGDRV
ncbi:hypothetical protein F5I97DRAFT_1817879 [Phlebopus sp. FC_14]|nr:hypothetical protein F5I97DRAFT_1817879 [Phlebopus sp. FC_14]